MRPPWVLHFLAGVFAGEAEDVLGRTGMVSCVRDRPWWPGDLFCLILYTVSLSPAAGTQGKPYPFFGSGEEQDKLQNRGVGLLILLGVGLNLWNDRFISAPTQKPELSS